MDIQCANPQIQPYHRAGRIGASRGTHQPHPAVSYRRQLLVRQIQDPEITVVAGKHAAAPLNVCEYLQRFTEWILIT